jgi:hypothetical protein
VVVEVVAVVVAAAVAVAAVAAVAVAAAALAADDWLLHWRTAVHCLVVPSSMVDLPGGRTWRYPEDNARVAIGSPTLML